ncbi:MAG: DEAD/DEAH box helicase [Planctomycetota bacterium]|nr:DEAD/DEAH box helicase [Planctomycetota bacterium]
MDISISPNGRLLLNGDALGTERETVEATLIDLVKNQDSKQSSPVLDFWRGFTLAYLTELCHIPEGSGQSLESLPESPHFLEFEINAPPMKGGEYLNSRVLEELWSDLHAFARKQVAKTPGGLSPWLSAIMPQWNRIGRVCFHLAENKNDPDDPFAFLATYSTRGNQSNSIQHVPLAHALEEYSQAKSKKQLIHLLSPISRAAKTLPWVEELVESGDIFHPLAWTPNEAWRLLKDLPHLDKAGLLVRVPDWWKQRSHSVQVNVSIGEKKKTTLNFESLLDFNVELTLDGKKLSSQEQQRLLAGSDSLVLLKGRWVELGGEQLKRTLNHWKKVEREIAGDGISFIQGMRLLSGAPADMVTESSPEILKWSEVLPGKWLAEQIEKLGQHKNVKMLPGKALKATLRPYQKQGVQWLGLTAQLGLGACLADDMGLGKTIQVIALILNRKLKKLSKKPVLVVLPASLVGNWESEITRFAPSLALKILHASHMKKEDLKSIQKEPGAFLKNTDVVLTTYGMLLRQAWLQETNWDVLILDEAQAIKNPATRQSRAAKKIKAAARIALTGTPIENKLGDLWSLFDFLNPGLLSSPNAFQKFVQALSKRPAQPYAPLRKLVQPYILRRLKTDKAIISDLPEKTEVHAYCKLTKKQAAHYKKAVKELALALNSIEPQKRRGLVLVFLLRFKQICNHPSQWLGVNDYEPKDSGKFLRLGEICEEIAARQEKVLIFTQYRSLCLPLALFLKGIFGRDGLQLHGGIPVKKRKPLIDAFQKENGPPFFVLSLKAGGTGLNLTEASHVVHFDRWWNPAVENQATDRAFRIGQKRKVLVHKFVCSGTVEERIDKLIQEKTDLADMLLRAGDQKGLTELNDKELLDLVRLDLNSALG